MTPSRRIGKTADMAQLISTAEVAERLGRSVSFINASAAEGKITPEVQFPGVKGARLYHPAEVERFAASLAERSGATS